MNERTIFCSAYTDHVENSDTREINQKDHEEWIVDAHYNDGDE